VSLQHNFLHCNDQPTCQAAWPACHATAGLAAAPPRGCAGLAAACTPRVAARAAGGTDAAPRPLPSCRVAGRRGPELTMSDVPPPACSDMPPLAGGLPLSALPSCNERSWWA